MKDFFYFLCELQPPFIDNKYLTKKGTDKEAGYMINKAKGYKIKIFELFKIVAELKLKVELEDDDESRPYVDFAEVTKSIIYRSYQKEKEKNDLDTVNQQRSVLDTKEEKAKARKKKAQSLIAMFKSGTKKSF